MSKKRQEEYAQNELVQAERKLIFEEINMKKSDIIFHLNGLSFLKFTHNKVKFMFIPSKLVDHVSTKVAFFCSLKYLEKYEHWIVKRDSFPVNLKWKIYSLFYESRFFAVDDYSVSIVIQKIYNRLELWSKREALFRLEKFKVR